MKTAIQLTARRHRPEGGGQAGRPRRPRRARPARRRAQGRACADGLRPCAPTCRHTRPSPSVSSPRATRGATRPASRATTPAATACTYSPDAVQAAPSNCSAASPPTRPFSPWVAAKGLGTGVALDLLARVRALLPGVEPLPLPRGAVLPQLDDPDALLALHAATSRSSCRSGGSDLQPRTRHLRPQQDRARRGCSASAGRRRRAGSSTGPRPAAGPRRHAWRRSPTSWHGASSRRASPASCAAPAPAYDGRSMLDLDRRRPSRLAARVGARLVRLRGDRVTGAASRSPLLPPSPTRRRSGERMTLLTIGRGGAYLRVADPDWDDPLSGEYARGRGGRWNPPGSFPVVYLNGDDRVARANLLHRFAGLPYGPEDLDPPAAPLLVSTDGARRAGTSTSSPTTAAGQPACRRATRCDAAGMTVPHEACRPVGQAAWDAGLPGDSLPQRRPRRTGGRRGARLVRTRRVADADRGPHLRRLVLGPSEIDRRRSRRRAAVSPSGTGRTTPARC